MKSRNDLTRSQQSAQLAPLDAMPSADRCVLPRVIARRAFENPQATAVVFDDGTQWTNEQAEENMLQVAAGLHHIGIGQGDRVLCWLPNGADLLRAWFGINQLGGIYVPINTAYRGRILQHIVNTTQAQAMIVHADLLERLTDIDFGPGLNIVVVGDAKWPERSDATFYDAGLLSQNEIPQEIVHCPAQPWDPYAVMYTSGTTGPSKGVTSSYLHVWATGAKSFGPLFIEGERCMATLPLFHAGGTVAVVCTLAQDAVVVILRAYETATFWQTVHRTGATMCTLLGVMASFLLKQPECDGDGQTSLRLVAIIPFTADAARFGKRFGCEVFTCFNMTETSTPLMSAVNPTALGACGRPRAGVEVQIVDERDLPVPVGQVGELVVRTDMPWTLFSGYWNDAEATARAWRNGWFHTGDAFRVDEAGDYFFVDRVKDAIRRRGENISSFEVEAELLSFAGVREAAAVAVSSEHSEDEVLAVVAPVHMGAIDPKELFEFLVGRMPHFMVPRYIRVMNELPKTATSKVEKHLLRTAGLTPDTWDCVAAGLRVRRERIGRRKPA